MDFIIATHNKHKTEEFKRILTPLNINIICADLPEVEETGKTFKENALLKAKSAYKATGKICVADDSGISVDILNGEPGIYSARYSGINATAKENIKKLLKKLEGVKKEDRKAHYTCAIACGGENIEFTVEGYMFGEIGFKEQGTNGFGYDPLFISEKGPLGLISAKEKDSISHRNAALKKFKEKLEELNLC